MNTSFDSSIIDVNGLVFDYDTTRALNGIDLRVAPQTICALVGPNGAGKSTLMRCIAALAEPFSGTVKVAGVDTTENPRRCHELLGYLPDFFGLYDALTVRQSLIYAGLSHGVEQNKIDYRIQEVATQLNLADLLTRKGNELSRGQRQRLAIAQTILHKPKLLLLDEPASGLDPEARIQLSQLLVSLGELGITIVVSSHILAELEDYSSEVIIMDKGEIVEQHRVDTGVNAGEQHTEIAVKLVEPYPDLRDLIARFEGVTGEPAGLMEFELSCSGGEAGQNRFLNFLIENGVKVCAFTPIKKTVRDIYMSKMVKGEGDA